MAKVDRIISQAPYRILDAPEISQDYYLNLLDWNKSNGLMVVCLGNIIYLWNEQTGETHQMLTAPVG
jgi:hypothetical protein